ncbi:MAG TPA: hypothetical protein VFP61_12950 [Acidimicrobiales bacterium]|nr:hypothetical protein [Acidimicrobiales bacterium]
MTAPAEETTHRGIRWQRSGSAVRWLDEAAGVWVRYRPGRDAPPRPPGWEPRRGLLPGGVTIDRPGWRTPYRIVPLVVLVAILVVGAAQALSGSGGQAAAEASASRALVGKCLTEAGFAGGRPVYAPKGVACSAPGAVVKVTSVQPGTPGAPTCPSGTLAVVLAYPGVRYPHQLCTVPNGG